MILHIYVKDISVRHIPPMLSWLKPILWPIAWARFAARMCGSKGLISTLIPADLSVQIFPCVAMVERPFLNVCPLNMTRWNRLTEV